MNHSMPDFETTWWAPVWRGLIVDPEGKHYRRLKGALWLLLYLFLHADWTTGTFRQKVSTIAEATGIPIRTIQGWLPRLKEHGYITARGTGRALVIQIRKWRTLAGMQKPALLPRRILQTRDAGTDISGTPENRRKALNPSRDRAQAPAPYESISTRDLLQNDATGKKSLTDATGGNPTVRPRTRQELLAWDLAVGLEDQRNFSRYLTYADQYPEQVLRQLLAQARAVPPAKIKRSRAALFTYLLKHHAETPPEDPRR